MRFPGELQQISMFIKVKGCLHIRQLVTQPFPVGLKDQDTMRWKRQRKTLKRSFGVKQ